MLDSRRIWQCGGKCSISHPYSVRHSAYAVADNHVSQRSDKNVNHKTQHHTVGPLTVILKFCFKIPSSSVFVLFTYFWCVVRDGVSPSFSPPWHCCEFYWPPVRKGTFRLLILGASCCCWCILAFKSQDYRMTSLFRCIHMEKVYPKTV